MKKRDLIKLLERNGWWLERHSGSHDIYTNGVKSISVPQHREIN